jgi:hypothetical protein
MHEISDVPGTELFQEIGAMEIDGARADAQCPSGLLAGGTPNDLSQRNTFFGSQDLMSGNGFDRISGAPFSLRFRPALCLRHSPAIPPRPHLDQRHRKPHGRMGCTSDHGGISFG